MTKAGNGKTSSLVNPFEDHLGYQLRRTSALLMADLGARLAPTGLRPTELTVLLVIRANKGCKQGAVGELLGIKPANMVPLIAGLVDKGLVERTKADGRSHSLSLTPLGRTRATAAHQLLERQHLALKSRLDEPSRKLLLATLATLRS